MFDDANEAISDDGNVNLNTYGILGFTPERLDAKVLFNPFKEKFNLPPVYIEQGYIFCSKVEVVRIIGKRTMKVWSIINNPSDSAWIMLHILFPSKPNCLITQHIVFPFKQILTRENLIFGGVSFHE